MVGLAGKRLCGVLFQQRGEPVEQRLNLRLIQHASGDEPLARTDRRQRGIRFQNLLDVVTPAMQRGLGGFAHSR
jgi:hypothetical protein